MEVVEKTLWKISQSDNRKFNPMKISNEETDHITIAWWSIFKISTSKFYLSFIRLLFDSQKN
jgi:hypothetical protein